MAHLWFYLLLAYSNLLMAPVAEGAVQHHGARQHVTPAACNACRAAHGVCPLRSGLFTRAQLPTGLNLVATIPRGACNLNITERSPSSNHLALRTHRDGRYALNGAWGVSDWAGEYAVAGTRVTYARGRGESLWAPGPLSEPLDVMLLVKHVNPGIHYQYHVPMTPMVDGFPTAALHPSSMITVPWSSEEIAEDDVAWRVAGHTPCSQSCGGGEQETVLACMRGLHVTLPPSHCEGMPQPEDVTIRCNTKPCPAQWEAGEWGPCSVTCGSGLQTRPLLCRQQISVSLTIKVAEGACLGVPPERSRRCHIRPCPSAALSDTRWSTSEWGPCLAHADCGQGVRTRRVWCTGDQDVEFPDMRCAATSRPPHEELCDAGSCVSNTWFFTEWTSQCSSRCGPGVQRRNLHCSGGGANAILPNDETHCDPRAKPADSRPCHGECSPTWFHGPWEQCPESCESDGVAHQTRSVVCVHMARGQMRVVADSRCAAQDKPSLRRPCPHQPPTCRAMWFYSDWEQCTGTCGAGQRTRDVRCLDPKLLIPSLECVDAVKPRTTDTCEPEHCTGGNRSSKNDRSHQSTNGVPASSSCGPDKLRNCALVVQARLCQYPYYRRACCTACANKHDIE